MGTIILITVESAKETIILLEQAIQHLDRCSESCGMVQVEMLQAIKFREVVLRSLELYLDKQMLILKSKCTVISKYETISKCKRKKT